MKTLALLSAMPFESDHILSSLKEVRRTKAGPAIVHKGKFAGKNIILSATGIGKVNAAIVAATVLEHFHAGRIICFGVGGAYAGSGLSIGDVAVATKEVYGDEGVIDSRGWHSIKKIGIPLVRSGSKQFFNVYPLPRVPVSSLTTATNGERKTSFRIKAGTFVTVSAATGTTRRARELEKRFHAVCENMEGAAVAHVCALYKIPLIEIRGISNITGVRDKRTWNLKLASRNAQRVVLGTLQS